MVTNNLKIAVGSTSKMMDSVGVGSAQQEILMENNNDNHQDRQPSSISSSSSSSSPSTIIVATSSASSCIISPSFTNSNGAGGDAGSIKDSNGISKASLIKYQHLSMNGAGTPTVINGVGNHHEESTTMTTTSELDGSDCCPPPSISKSSSLLLLNSSVIEENDDDHIGSKDVCCLLCNSRFDLSRHKRFVCKICALNICCNCSLYDDDSWICMVCHQQRTIANNSKCQSWLCKRIMKQVKERDLLHFVNAKLRFNNNHHNLYFIKNEEDSTIPPSLANGHNTISDDDLEAERDGSSQNGSDNHHHQMETSSQWCSSLGSLDQQHQNHLRYNIDHQDHEHLLSIRSDMESILEKLLGIETIDYSHVGYIFEDEQYRRLIDTYVPLLTQLIMIVQRSTYLSDCGRETNPTPKEALNRLKDKLNEISEKSYQFPIQLRPKSMMVVNDNDNNDLQRFLDLECHSYEQLLAISIVNQIIEDGQTRFMTATSTASKSSSGASSDLLLNNQNHYYTTTSNNNNNNGNLHNLHHRHYHQHNSNNHKHGLNRKIRSLSGGSGSSNETSKDSAASTTITEYNHHHYHHHLTNNSVGYNKLKTMDNDYSSMDVADQDSENWLDCDRPNSSKDIDEPSDHVAADFDDGDEQEEWIEDDQHENNSDYNHQDDDVDMYADEYQQDNQEDDFGLELNFEQSKVYFPEAGLDLIDSKKFSSMDSNISQDSGIKLIDNTQSWQDNWYFKKNKDNKSYKQYHVNTDIHFGYMALALSEPVPMLIPNPSQLLNPMLGELEADQVSDLSEHNSDETGSIIFSSEDEDNGDDQHQEVRPQTEQQKKEGKENAFNKNLILKDGNNALNVAEEATIHDKNAPNTALSSSTTVYIENRRGHHPQSQSSTNGQWSEKCRKNKAIIQSHRWSKIKVPDFVPNELRTICSSIPNPHVEDLDYVPSFTLKPGNASIHSGILAQFCCKAQGLMPLHFAWYKDGQLIAASNDDSRSLIEMENNRLARTYFGVRYIHRRYVESNCSAYRLIVFNDNECILELKKSSPIHGGIYSVVAYNHSGNDWCDFKLIIDRSHFSTVNTTATINNGASVGLNPMSPRPVLRRPQHRTRKTNNHKADNNNGHTSNFIVTELVTKIESPIMTSTESSNINLEKKYRKSNSNRQNNSLQHPKTMPHVIQRTWLQRKASESNDNKLLLAIMHSEKLADNHIGAGNDQVDGRVDDNDGGNFGDGDDHYSSPLIQNSLGESNKVPITESTRAIATEIIHSKRFDENGQMFEEFNETVQILDKINKDNDDGDQQLSPQPQPSSTSWLSDNFSSLNDSINIPVMPIAEREHRKWNNPDVSLANNPYSPENIEKRVQQQHRLLCSPSLDYSNVDESFSSTADTPEQMKKDPNAVEEEEFVPEEKKRFFHSSARDMERYKRDYYLPKTKPKDSGLSILNSLGGKHHQPTSPSSTSSSSTTLILKHADGHNNHHHNHNEREKQHSTNGSKREGNCDGRSPSSSVEDHHHSIESTTTNDSIDHHPLTTKEPILSDIPSFGQNKVKSLTSLFSSPPPQSSSSSSSSSAAANQQPHSFGKSNSLSPIPAQNPNSKHSNDASVRPTALNNSNNNNYAVFSLTGRSIPKEFREKSQKNLPRFNEMNRIGLANEMLASSSSTNPNVDPTPNLVTTTIYVEQDGGGISHNGEINVASLESDGSDSAMIVQNGLKHDKINSKNNNNNGTGAIKKRAVFWEKRIEENQISDYQVEETFPTMDGSTSTSDLKATTKSS